MPAPAWRSQLITRPSSAAARSPPGTSSAASGLDEPPAQANRDVNLDIGETVHVDAWNADGTATVKYRGANWTVIALDGTVHGTGAHRVREVVGNRLVVEKI